MTIIQDLVNYVIYAEYEIDENYIIYENYEIHANLAKLRYLCGILDSRELRNLQQLEIYEIHANLQKLRHLSKIHHQKC